MSRKIPELKKKSIRKALAEGDGTVIEISKLLNVSVFTVWKVGKEMRDGAR